MNWNKLFTSLAYVAGAAATAIPTMGLSVPAWLAGGLVVVATVSGKLAASHVSQINYQAALAAAAGAAAKAASDSLGKK